MLVPQWCLLLVSELWLPWLLDKKKKKALKEGKGFSLTKRWRWDICWSFGVFNHVSYEQFLRWQRSSISVVCRLGRGSIVRPAGFWTEAGQAFMFRISCEIFLMFRGWDLIQGLRKMCWFFFASTVNVEVALITRGENQISCFFPLSVPKFCPLPAPKPSCVAPSGNST